VHVFLSLIFRYRVSFDIGCARSFQQNAAGDIPASWVRVPGWSGILPDYVINGVADGDRIPAGRDDEGMRGPQRETARLSAGTANVGVAMLFALTLVLIGIRA